MANNIYADNVALVKLGASLEAAQWRSEREAVLARGETVTQVTNNDELETAAEVEKEAKTLVRVLSAKRLELTRQIDAEKKAIMKAEENEASGLLALISRLDAMSVAYARVQAARAEDERRRIEAAQLAQAEAELAAREQAEAEAAANAAFGLAPSAPQSAAPVSSVAVPTPTVKKASSSCASFSEVWRYEILDANAVPRELCSPDATKIRAVLAAKKAEGYAIENVVINGLRIYKDVQMRVK